MGVDSSEGSLSLTPTTSTRNEKLGTGAPQQTHLHKAVGMGGKGLHLLLGQHGLVDYQLPSPTITSPA